LRIVLHKKQGSIPENRKMTRHSSAPLLQMMLVLLFASHKEYKLPLIKEE
jgi:hypothetical protein